MLGPRCRNIICLVAALLMLTPLAAAGSDFSLKSVTSATTWDEEDGTSNSSASEYVKFLNRSTFAGFRLDFDGYGRVTRLEKEIEPGDENPNRLYVLALTMTSEDDRNVIVLGRQFVPALVGPQMIDGLSVQTQSGKITFNGRWGHKSDLSGGPEEDKILGFGFDFQIKPEMYLSLDYGRTYSDRLLSELLASEWTYSWFRYTKAYFKLNWDLMSQTLHGSTLGTHLYFSDRFSAIFELGHNVEVFDSDSIYSVFAQDAAYTRSFSLLFTPIRTTRYKWDYFEEYYQGGGKGRGYALDGHWTPGSLDISGSLSQHSGYGGNLTEITGDFSTPIFGKLRAGVGGDFSRTENTDESSVVSSLLYFSAGLDLGSKSALNLRVERCDDDLTDPTGTARLALKMEL